MPAKELKDYSRQELEAELDRRRESTRMSPEEVRQFWLQAAGLLKGIDIDAWLAEIRWQRGHDCEDQCRCDSHLEHG